MSVGERDAGNPYIRFNARDAKTKFGALIEIDHSKPPRHIPNLFYERGGASLAFGS
ncbi:MAG: hypothetical protein J4F39_10945 [Candidatus Latescibacteria bacterium]|nr:hypothetical protein [Candidatus Latescibacterota bacterium]